LREVESPPDEKTPKRCPDCDGPDPKQPDSGNGVCSACHGKRTDKTGVCAECGGTGTCLTCNGFGTVEA
jgi:hypothetical protein